MNETAADILRQARELIADPERWTQGEPARCQRGRSVSTRSPEAQSWCAYGAVMRFGGGHKAGDFLRDGATQLFGWGMSDINDRKPRAQAHPEVLAMFDRAIELAEAGQA